MIIREKEGKGSSRRFGPLFGRQFVKYLVVGRSRRLLLTVGIGGCSCSCVNKNAPVDGGT